MSLACSALAVLAGVARPMLPLPLLLLLLLLLLLKMLMKGQEGC
jgi:hypothetical protein